MERIIIDTNILYSIVGVSENEKVTNSKLGERKLSITTASLIEVIVKYRDDIDTIKRCLVPIVNETIELISIGHAPLSTEHIKNLANSNSQSDVQSIIDEQLELKVLKEAEFLRFVLIIVFSGMIQALREDGYSFDDPVKSNQQLFMVKSLLMGNEDFMLSYFKDKIVEGYKKNDEQKVVLEAFHEKLICLLNVFNFNFHQVKTGALPINGQDLDSDKAQLLNASLTNDNFDKKIARFASNPIEIVSKRKNHELFDSFLHEMNDGLMDLDSLTTDTLNFVMLKIESSYKNKAKIRKNDAFDFLISFSLGMPESKIVTLDKAFAKSLEKIDSDSYKLCQELGFVS